MISRPDAMQSVYLDACGVVALAILEPAAKRSKADVLISRAPWALAARRGRPINAAFWYVDARAAERVRKLLLPHYLAGSSPVDIVRAIFRTTGQRAIAHAVMMAAADSTIAEINRRFDHGRESGAMRDINRGYKEYRLARWTANEAALSWDEYLLDLKKTALRRALGKRL